MLHTAIPAAVRSLHPLWYDPCREAKLMDMWNDTPLAQTLIRQAITLSDRLAGTSRVTTALELASIVALFIRGDMISDRGVDGLAMWVRDHAAVLPGLYGRDATQMGLTIGRMVGECV